MKTLKLLLLFGGTAGLGFAAAYVMVSNRLMERYQAELAQHQATWQAEKAELEAAWQRANAKAPAIERITLPGQVVTVTNRTTPQEILARLKAAKAVAGQPLRVRYVIHQFESLVETGPAALPAIRNFLALKEDVDYDATGLGKSARDGQIPTTFTLPPSLRLGLFEAVKNIGGSAAEQVLAESLSATGRGIEVAYLARALQELAPGKYRELALTTAREMLSKPRAPASASPLDQFDREYLYGVLGVLADPSYVAQAQTQVIKPDGQIDRVALRYVQQVLGEQSLAVAAQLWQDTRIPADQKEPLARVALAYAGANSQANEFFATAINDPNLPPNDRKNLIEDLNQDGFADRKNFSARDLSLIQNRIALIEQLAPNPLDQVNTSAFQEAYKDLLKMRERAVRAATPAPSRP